MATRLERLILLLDTGSTTTVRTTAAQQIGEIQRQQPDQLYNLLGRVLVHLRSTEWATRIAAGHAIEAIAKNVPQWEPPVPANSDEDAVKHALDADSDGLLRFESFDIGNVVKNGAPLLASAGREFDIDHSDMDPKERIALQKKELKKRLGMGTEFMKDLLDESDVVSAKSPTDASQSTQQSAQQLLDLSSKSTRGGIADDDPSMAGLSQRQKATLKRKMRMMGKDRGSKVRIVEVSATKQRKSLSDAKPITASIKIKQEDEESIMNGSPMVTSPSTETPPNDDKVVVEAKVKQEPAFLGAIHESGDEWPFEGLCEQLCLDLFSPSWETRHGAAIGLRAVLKVHGSGAGKLVGIPLKDNAARHRAWLEDVAIRLLCVLALDRFGDYGSDQAVAPVRETAAQTLGVVMQWSEQELCLTMVNQGLLKLLEASEEQPVASGTAHGGRGKGWQVRHGALVGLKYWMAVRKDLLPNVFGSQQEGKETALFRAVINGLRDHDDDVRAVSSSALLPVCDLLVKILPVRTVFYSIVMTLWNCLEELDDLTSATGSVMDLLSQLMMKPEIVEIMKAESASSLQELIPRLYPFFRHAIVSVRQAVLRTVATFVDVTYGSNGSWVTMELLRLVFQNFIIEERKDIGESTSEVWKKLMRFMEAYNAREPGQLKTVTLSVLPAWFALVMTPVGSPLDLRFFYSPGASQSSKPQGVHGKKRRGDTDGFNVSPHDKAMAEQDLTVISRDDVIRGRLAGATALGGLVCALFGTDDSEVEERVRELVTAYLNSGWVGHRVFCNVMLDEWAGCWQERNAIQGSKVGTETAIVLDSVPLADVLWGNMVKSLAEADSGTTLLYSELVHPLLTVRNECEGLLAASAEFCGKDIPALPELPSNQGQRPSTPFGNVFTLTVAEHVVQQVVPKMIPPTCPPRTATQIQDRIRRATAVIDSFRETQRKLEVQVLASMASAVVRMGRLPAKTNPIIRSLMNSVKEEVNEDIQSRAARGVAGFIELNIKLGKPVAINEKVIKNLSAFLCGDPSVRTDKEQVIQKKDGILTITFNETLNSSSLEDVDASRKTKTNGAAKKGGRGKRKSAGPGVDSTVTDTVSEADTAALSASEEVEKKSRAITARGAEYAFREICERFGAEAFVQVPKLWSLVATNLLELAKPDQPIASVLEKYLTMEGYAQELVHSLHLLSKLLPYLHTTLYSTVITVLPGVASCLRASLAIVRHMAARCMAAFCQVITAPAMQALVDHVLPLLGDTNNLAYRQGAAECVHHIVRGMDHSILPYIIFLIIPVLGRMSDPDEEVRFVSTNVFAQLVKLVPLESGIPDPEGFSDELIRHRKEERKFIGQLIGSEKVEEFELPVPIKAELRSYQKEGISWLAFLNRYGLHGILCDDMGLGKTLQSICMLASDHHNRAERYKKTSTPDSAHAPSLVVCPPTLTGHWSHEIQTYAEFLKPVIYGGNVQERAEIRRKIPNYDVVILSYEILRNDIDELSRFHFNYCILDEGHIIKNPKTKITQAVKSIQSLHRLILSGTPIQNNVLELWSLFDFLMPGFLGTERLFNDRFGKPILASRDAKSSSKEQEQGALAMEALHKQVLPFLLRRMKEDVLHDLPPKIIQDYYCELSDLQKSLYEDFAKSQAKEGAEKILVGEEVEESNVVAKKQGGKTGHVFQALQYLRKLVNHPALVVNPSHPQWNKVQGWLSARQSHIRDIEHAPKIQALGQLLQDCGIGVDPTSNPTTTAVAPHRALIFAQLRPMLDMIEKDLFKTLMPSVSYLRLDGTTDASTRHDLVRKFNQDASIDVLLLTTHVGGLGLTLTGADTVIFVEHDWNPMKDLQAMDRAHRIGQKRVVNVYRLITKGTLEEKIMGLQKFKLNIASSVINQENAGLRSMDTDQILDLFSIGGPSESAKPKQDKSKKATAKDVLEGLEELADQDQYEDLDVGEFLKGLK
ncbi:DNA-binding ATPase [Spizellomyces punctatus DAOM BR117]|uniref:TATA-binding protein-associated factor mot1 n=1 Tax=Spizellomyces punctatus (strain DAOM BR117) TaxID=645134 RepID=A0A0L0HUY9_SPIPD|nr:DNA-binding ATPase [Spizellomyces punctatus DAOM BR117]KND04710.1 hypothetical protein SPPG_00419 [Spizellomyces punctatus DAOM BR117]|eukprot:XP_016612749.1 hypothetical protein SPPG_00419 [Spizellomyces punctatus DAOM BR117]